jgi:imidazoleglycerol-phosphate dehydratase
VKVSHDDISAAKAKGDANNDWILTQRLCAAKGMDVEFEAVKAKFEELYQGVPGVPGLCTLETLIPARGTLEELARRCPNGMAVVTGRPRSDCAAFLKTHDLGHLFKHCVCMEDGPAKPDPTPCRLAIEKLGVPAAECIMVGDTPDGE